jgi:putative membrane protein
MITQTDVNRVVDAIRDAELRTAGEIYCVVTYSSSSYRLVPIAWAALLALLVPLPLIYLTDLPAGTIYMLQLAIFIVAVAVLSLPVLRYRIVPRKALHARAHAEAIRQFLAHGLHLTEDRTGVLIFASVAERYAEIVADANINNKVGPEVWERAIATLILAIKAGRPGDGFVAAVEQCGDVLAQHFPPGTMNRDELPNRLVVM